MGRLIQWLDTLPPAVINSVALGLLLLIGAMDYLTPPEITTSVFYMAPIALAAWFGGRTSGVAMAILAACAWMVKDVAFRGVSYAEQWVLFWNTAARLIMFSVVAWLITEVRSHLLREQQLSRADPLTGLLNARAFREELSLELVRAGRTQQPVSFAYLDLDNFKPVNDEHGHAEGDRALATVAGVLRRALRRTDTLGRLGGDEFAVILPSTDAAEAASVVRMVQAELKAEMARHAWPITFSIGLVTCSRPPLPDALVREADRLMYQVKAAGRNAVLHSIWSAPNDV